VPTFSQLVRMGREASGMKTKFARAGGCPEKSAACAFACTRRRRKKPNSALRKVARVRLTNAIEVTTYIGRRPPFQEALDRAVREDA